MARESRDFGVTLVLGDTQAGPSGTLTPGAAKALSDLKDFLPYKTYRALDTLWTGGSDLAHPSMHGLGDQEYDFYMHSTVVSATVTKVDMLRLWDATARHKAEDERKALMASMSALIDTSFSIEAGETVVVGTSRLKGSEALILLVTAVQR